ncbi:MAG: HEPN domain-containing protein [Candidatus Freyrarchaeum guaymaensis]|nr:HEPN domain-containing protein [Candidatus Freyarchaeota archaeon]
MTTEPSREYVRRCLELADEFLSAARLCIKYSKQRSAVNNAYYAMFYASLAILASKGVKLPKTHEGLRRLVGKEIIKAGLLEKEFGRYLSEAFEMRQASTYDVYVSFSEETIRETMKKAELFTERIKRLLEESPGN